MDVFDLFAKISLDKSEYDKRLNEAGGSLSSFGDKLKSGLATAGKITAAGIGAASAAVGALAKTSIDAYGEYEQLVGGANLMFGNAFDTVMEKSQNAYKTVQMSQNEYLRQVNGFATGLKTALGGNEQAAADLAHKIIQAEADVVAATGNSQEAVQNAFNGIMKSNFTMLDNLQIGITPTKKGFQEVIDKVNKWNKANGKATKYQMGNLADMQSALVDYIDMVGMSGYAQNEASQTIQGSLASMKSAWTNLITGIADENANLDVLISNFVDSVSTAGENLIPRVQQILVEVGQSVATLAPMLAAQIPTLIETVLPSMLTAGTQLLVGLITGIAIALPQLVEAVPSIVKSFVNAITANLPAIQESGQNLLSMFGDGIVNGTPNMIEKLPEVINGFLNFIAEELPKVLLAGISMLVELRNGINQATPELLASVPVIIKSFVDTISTNLPAILDAGSQMLYVLGGGIQDAIPAMLEMLPKVIDSFLGFVSEHLPDVMNSGVEILNKLVTGIINTIPKMLAQLPAIITSFVEFIVSSIPVIIKAGMDILANLVVGIINNLPEIEKAVGSIVNAIADGFIDLSESILDIGENIVSGIWSGIVSKAEWIKDKVTGLFSGIVDGVKETLGIHSPSRVFAGIGENMALGLGKGWDDEYSAIKKDIEGGMEFGTANVNFASSAVGVSTAGMVNGITAGMNQGMGMAPMTFKLVLPSGVELATYLLDPLASVANANGTPILNPA